MIDAMRALPSRVVTQADVQRVITYWVANSTISMYTLVPDFLRAVALRQIEATDGAVALATVHWNQEVERIEALLTGAP